MSASAVAYAHNPAGPAEDSRVTRVLLIGVAIFADEAVGTIERWR